MKILWDGSSEMNTPTTTYASYANAEKAANKKIGHLPVRVLICATREGRFFYVAIGQQALDHNVHHMGVHITG